MKNILSFFFMILVLLWTISAISAEKNGEAMIESIHFLEENDIETIQVKLSSRIVPRVFELNGDNPRVVCDFLNTGYPAGNRRVIAAGGDLIKRVRVGLHHTPVVKTRIVIDLKESSVFSVVRDFREEENKLIIRILKKAKQPEESQAPAEPVTAAPVEKDEKNEISTSSPPPAPVDSDKQASTESVQQSEDEPEGSFEKGIDAFEDNAEADGSAEEEDTATEEGSDKQTSTESLQQIEDEPEGSFEKGTDAFKDNAEADGTAEEEDTSTVEAESKRFAALHDVTFERSTNDQEMVLFKLNGFYPPIVFSTEENNLLVVCDFLDAVLAIGIDPVIETKGEYIRKVKISTHRDPDKVRVVLELADSYNYDLKQVFFKEDNLFVIIISNLGEK